jgi:phosphoribosylanthranilate isomerase
MFKIKVCGIKTVADALAAVEAGADAIGLNFYAPSPRSIDRGRAAEIAKAVGDRVCKVGLFVNAPVNEVRATADEIGLDLIQLHGDERADHLRGLGPRPVMKALRLGPDGLASVRNWLDDAMRSALLPKLLLLDGFKPGQYGGTGAVADWNLAAQYARTPGVPPLVLAGGLTAENVGEAIHAVRPAAVDTAGGVESLPGVKDAAKMQAFVAAAKAAFDVP